MRKLGVYCAVLAAASACGGGGGSGSNGSSSSAGMWAGVHARPTQVPGFREASAGASLAALATATSGPALASLAVGDAHGCGIAPEGNVKCWGSSYYGQLGTGLVGSYDDTTHQAYQPYSDSAVAVPGTQGATAVASGAAHSCALVKGAVWCWGYDWYSDLGQALANITPSPPGSSSATPVQVAGLGTVTAIAAGRDSGCAMNDAGELKCWGWWNNFDGKMPYDEDIAFHRVVDVGAKTGTTIPALGFIESGDSTRCLAPTDGGLLCWGRNDHGQVGDGSIVSQYAPVAVPALAGVKIVSVVGGYTHTCALTSAGTVKCWGENLYGSVGDGTTEERHQPVDVTGLAGLTVAAIAAGRYHTCAAISTGGVKCWGRNIEGQLGIGSVDELELGDVPHATPLDVVDVSGVVFESLSARQDFTCGLTASGIMCWGTGLSSPQP